MMHKEGGGDQRDIVLCASGERMQSLPSRRPFRIQERFFIVDIGEGRAVFARHHDAMAVRTESWQPLRNYRTGKFGGTA